jgi:hypothetical protein
MEAGWNKRERRLLVLIAAAVFAVAAILVVGCGGNSDNSGGNAHINEESGSTNGIPPDEREGIPPAPAQETDLKVLAERANCYLFLDTKDEGHKQLANESAAPEYEWDPPISGPHVEPPYQQADGAYSEQPEYINVVAALEHGRMAIQYAPDISDELQLELKGLYETMYGGTLLFPNYLMNFAVAATTWTNILSCPGWEKQKTIDAIRAFGKATWGKYGGEPVEDFPVEGPTPRNPEEPEAS